MNSKKIGFKTKLKEVYKKSYLLRGQIVGLIVGIVLFFFYRLFLFLTPIISLFLIEHKNNLLEHIIFFSGTIIGIVSDPIAVFRLSRQPLNAIYPGNVMALLLIYVLEFMIIFSIIHFIEKKKGKLNKFYKIVLIILLFLILNILFFFVVGQLISMVFFGGLV